MKEKHKQNAYAQIRFYAELNDLLPKNLRYTEFQVHFAPHTSIKHLVESLGVPHTEIDLILVNGLSVDFSYLPARGDLISVYPVFESLDISPIIKLRPKPLRDPHFILDTHLGKLSVYLRMLGFDTLYQNDYQDKELAMASNIQKRILLTRDRGLLKRNEITHGYYVRATHPKQQIIEIIQRFDLYNRIQPFRRCLECNHPLERVDKQQVIPCLQPDTIKSFDEFHSCPACQRIYWKGSHYERMRNFIQEIIT